LVSDARRKVMKDILKHNSSSGASSSSSSTPSSEQEDISAIANAQVLSRSIPGAVIAHFVAKIATLEEEMVNVMKEERMRAKVAAAEEEATRAENMILHEAEISARPARTWYQTETQKKALRDAGREKVKAELEALAEDEDAGAQQKKARKRGRNSHGESDDDDEGYDEGLLQSEKLAKKLAGSDDYRRDEPVKGEGKVCIVVPIYVDAFRMYTYAHLDIQTYRHTDIQTCRHTDIQTYRYTDIRKN
jgi:hypothetical protein